MSYLHFNLVGDTGNTKKFHVHNNQNGEQIGAISFYPMWRKYVFKPLPDTFYDAGCLKEIATFLEDQQTEWRAGQKVKNILI